MCTENHTVYSTDPRFLEKMETALPHRTGFTRGFIHCVTGLVQEGLPTQAIVRHIRNTREAFTSTKVMRVRTNYMQWSGHEMTDEQTSSLIAATTTKALIEPLPTNDAIARCFILTFQENEMHQMMQLKVNRCIWLDHTFN